MSDRSRESVLFEAEYWRPVMDDVLAMNELVGTLSSSLVAIPIDVLALVVAMVPRGITTGEAASLDSITNAALESIGTLGEMQARLKGILELANGRATALREEAGLEPEPES